MNHGEDGRSGRHHHGCARHRSTAPASHRTLDDAASSTCGPADWTRRARRHPGFRRGHRGHHGHRGLRPCHRRVRRPSRGRRDHGSDHRGVHPGHHRHRRRPAGCRARGWRAWASSRDSDAASGRRRRDAADGPHPNGERHHRGYRYAAGRDDGPGPSPATTRTGCCPDAELPDDARSPVSDPDVDPKRPYRSRYHREPESGAVPESDGDRPGIAAMRGATAAGY